MKKNLFALGVALASAFTLTNCTEEIQNPQEGKTPYTIYANAAETKTANDGLSTVWMAGDALTVFHAQAGSTEYGESTKFTLTDAASGQFDADELKGELSSSNDWYALYPASDYVKTPAAKSEGYVYFGNKNGMEQNGYNSTAHLCGNACPLYGVRKAVSDKDLPGITMNHLTAVVQINVKNGTSSPVTINDISFSSYLYTLCKHKRYKYVRKNDTLFATKSVQHELLTKDQVLVTLK